jgi:hypothetical protein
MGTGVHRWMRAKFINAIMGEKKISLKRKVIDNKVCIVRESQFVRKHKF